MGEVPRPSVREARVESSGTRFLKPTRALDPERQPPGGAAGPRVPGAYSALIRTYPKLIEMTLH